MRLIQWALKAIEKRRNSLAIISVLLLASVLINWQLNQWYKDRLLAHEHTHMQQEIAPYAHALGTIVNHHLSQLEGLAAFAQTHPTKAELDEAFEMYAHGLYTGKVDIRAIQMFPKNTSAYVYPTERNEAVIGRTLDDLINDERPSVRADVQRAIETRQIVISDPYELHQGGLGLAARLAVVDQDELWGLVVIELEVEPILSEAGLETISFEIEAALRDTNDNVLSGSASVFESDPVTGRISLPGGHWEIAAIPSGGWEHAIADPLRVFRITSWAIVILVITMSYMILSRQEHLTRAINESTRELVGSQLRYQQLFDSNSDALFVLDTEGRVLAANHTACERYQYTLDEMLTLTAQDLAVPALADKIPERLVATTTGQHQFESRHRRKDGSEIAVEIRSHTFKINAETRIVSSVRDITERKKAEQELRASRAQLQAILDHSPALISIKDLQGTIVLTNRNFEVLEGPSPEEYIGKNVYELFPKEIADKFWANDLAALHSGEPIEAEEIVRHKDGTDHTYLTVKFPLFDDGPDAFGICAISTDITERKRSEEALLQRERRLRAQNTVLLSLMARGSWFKSNLHHTVAEITEACSELVQTQRVSAWWFDEDESTIRCFDLYNRDTRQHDEGETLDVTAFPTYWGNISQGKVVDAVDVYLDPRTSEVPATYYQKHKVRSLLDVPIWLGNKVGGVLSFEHVNQPRQWSQEDTRLATTMATLISLASEAHERKRAEEALHESEEKYRLLVELAPNAIVVHQDGLIAFANPAAARLVGAQSSDELLGRSIRDFVHPDTWGAARDRIQRMQAGETGLYPAEDRYLKLDGSEVPVAVIAAPFTHKGRMAFQVIATDITQRKNAESELKQYAERLTALQNLDHDSTQAHLPLTVARSILGHLQHLIPYTRATVDFYDQEAMEIVVFGAETEHDQTNPDDTRFLYTPNEAIAQLISGKAIIEPDLSLLTPAQSIGWERLAANGVRSTLRVPISAGAQFIGTLTLVSNTPDFFTEEHREIGLEVTNQFESAMRQARLIEQIEQQRAELEACAEDCAEQLEAANIELKAMAYSISHDLRAPLHTISAALGIFNETYLEQLPEKAQHYLNLTSKNAQHMDQLIDDLLRFSLMSHQELKKQPVDLTHVARQALDYLHIDQEERTIEISIQEMPVCHGDPALIQRVIANLLGNAIKFTQGRDTAIIEVGHLEQDDEIVYFVKDNGVGFDMQHADRLFGVFQRMHRPDDFEGTDVGLAIVQRIIHRHGGKVWVDSTEGEGSTFYFTLPASPDYAAE